MAVEGEASAVGVTVEAVVVALAVVMTVDCR